MSSANRSGSCSGAIAAAMLIMICFVAPAMAPANTIGDDR